MKVYGIVLASVAICCLGCQSVKDEPGGYWYQADRPLSAAVHDCRECLYEARFLAGTGKLGPDAREVFSKCMHERGYRRVSEKSLDPAVQTARVPGLDVSEPVAGN